MEITNDISTICDTYTPSIDENGNYFDKVPPFRSIKGLRCPCNNRSKEQIYETSAKFTSHTKTKGHQKWLEILNNNKTNYYAECEELKEVVQQQRLIIAKLEKEIQKKIMTIDFLTEQITAKKAKTQTVNDLLGFD